MAGENDETKWVGVRPTDPAETIPVEEQSPLTTLPVSPALGYDPWPVEEQSPLTSIEVEPTAGSGNFPVTESAPLTDILVAPSAGSPEFLTLTKKRTPAIADLQAMEALVTVYETGVVAAGRFDHSFAAVTAGKIWVITQLGAYCGTTWGNSNFYIRRGADWHAIASPAVTNLFSCWNGKLLLDASDYILMENRSATNGANYHLSLRGYQVDIY